MKEEDKAKVDEAVELIKNVVESNTQIPSDLWISALFCLIAHSCLMHKVPFDIFQKAVIEMSEQCKFWWKDE